MTNLIVISSEADLVNEAGTVNDLFHEGLQLFHLRKPGWNISDQRNFLNKIDIGFHNRISVHQHYDSIEEFGLKYFHAKEKDRKNIVKIPGLKYSTSFHYYTDLQFESHYWDYCFFGPVFDSISKSGYKSSLANDFHNEGDIHQKVFALGGITKENIEIVFRKEFYGAAVLGSIWHDRGNAVKNFKALKEKCSQHVHTY